MRNQPVFKSVVGAGTRGRPVRHPLPAWRQGLVVVAAAVVWLMLAPFAVPATTAAPSGRA